MSLATPALALERPTPELSPGLALTRGWATPLLAWGVDMVALNFAFVLAYWIRYPLGFPSAVIPFDYRPLQDFFPAELSLTVIVAIILPYTGLYRRTRGTGWMSKTQDIFSGTTVS
ncbi:MAG TPA: hypothetical protein VKU60_12635, partial [Chloroflexota bacterium]|nr:hypothetical protein [Chloroflexota bacterium]